jgi:hypothetical protein
VLSHLVCVCVCVCVEREVEWDTYLTSIVRATFLLYFQSLNHKELILINLYISCIGDISLKIICTHFKRNFISVPITVGYNIFVYDIADYVFICIYILFPLT